MQTIQKNVPLHRQVADLLSERIISGEYAPGALLPGERELGETLGVSRTVVREAVKNLESRRLVRIEHGRGTVVQEADGQPVADSLRVALRRGAHVLEDLLEVRRSLEVALAGLAARRRSEENLDALRRALEVMRSKPDQPEGYVDADVAFHTEIARAAQNPVFLILLEPLAELLADSRRASFAGPAMVKRRLRQHEEIFEAIRRGDGGEAMAAMARHLGDTGEDLQRSRKQSGRRS
jgi:GntR family transcriptional repressor for pyruvate dehydrogenase complex